MAQNVRITCINKSDRFNSHERIRNVGGQGWKMTEQQAITAIENGTYQFYVHAAGVSVWVVIATSQWGHKYLKTQPDGIQPDNLLSLPECP
jgi:Protein of unknown function (DUF3892)